MAKTGVEYALTLIKSRADLARKCDVSGSAVDYWTSGIPPKRALILHDEFGLDLTKLNPKVYPKRIFGNGK